MTEYLEFKHVVAMHDALIEKYGGIKGFRNDGLLRSAIGQPMQNVFGQELFPDIPSKAAAYAFYISENQPFLDGNKRTAAACALTFLRLNEYDLCLPLKTANQNVLDILMKIANKEITREEVSHWFQKNCRRKRQKIS